MTTVGPSNSMSVISTVVGTTLRTTSRALLRMSSKLIATPCVAGRKGREVRSGELHRRLAALDLFLVEFLEPVAADHRHVDALAGGRVPAHRHRHRADREVHAVLHVRAVDPVVFEH